MMRYYKRRKLPTPSEAALSSMMSMEGGFNLPAGMDQDMTDDMDDAEDYGPLQQLLPQNGSTLTTAAGIPGGWGLPLPLPVTNGIASTGLGTLSTGLGPPPPLTLLQHQLSMTSAEQQEQQQLQLYEQRKRGRPRAPRPLIVEECDGDGQADQRHQQPFPPLPDEQVFQLQQQQHTDCRGTGISSVRLGQQGLSLDLIPPLPLPVSHGSLSLPFDTTQMGRLPGRHLSSGLSLGPDSQCTLSSGGNGHGGVVINQGLLSASMRSQQQARGPALDIPTSAPGQLSGGGGRYAVDVISEDHPGLGRVVRANGGRGDEDEDLGGPAKRGRQDAGFGSRSGCEDEAAAALLAAAAGAGNSGGAKRASNGVPAAAAPLFDDAGRFTRQLLPPAGGGNTPVFDGRGGQLRSRPQMDDEEVALQQLRVLAQQRQQQGQREQQQPMPTIQAQAADDTAVVVGRLLLAAAAAAAPTDQQIASMAAAAGIAILKDGFGAVHQALEQAGGVPSATGAVTGRGGPPRQYADAARGAAAPAAPTVQADSEVLGGAVQFVRGPGGGRTTQSAMERSSLGDWAPSEEPSVRQGAAPLSRLGSVVQLKRESSSPFGVAALANLAAVVGVKDGLPVLPADRQGSIEDASAAAWPEAGFSTGPRQSTIGNGPVRLQAAGMGLDNSATRSPGNTASNIITSGTKTGMAPPGGKGAGIVAASGSGTGMAQQQGSGLSGLRPGGGGAADPTVSNTSAPPSAVLPPPPQPVASRPSGGSSSSEQAASGSGGDSHHRCADAKAAQAEVTTLAAPLPQADGGETDGPASKADAGRQTVVQVMASWPPKQQLEFLQQLEPEQVAELLPLLPESQQMALLLALNDEGRKQQHDQRQQQQQLESIKHFDRSNRESRGVPQEQHQEHQQQRQLPCTVPDSGAVVSGGVTEQVAGAGVNDARRPERDGPAGPGGVAGPCDPTLGRLPGGGLQMVPGQPSAGPLAGGGLAAGSGSQLQDRANSQSLADAGPSADVAASLLALASSAATH